MKRKGMGRKIELLFSCIIAPLFVAIIVSITNAKEIEAKEKPMDFEDTIQQAVSDGEYTIDENGNIIINIEKLNIEEGANVQIDNIENVENFNVVENETVIEETPHTVETPDSLLRVLEENEKSQKKLQETEEFANQIVEQMPRVCLMLFVIIMIVLMPILVNKIMRGI